MDEIPQEIPKENIIDPQTYIEEKPKEAVPEKKEEKITKCPEDVPTAIFDCLATMTDCERLKLTKDEAARMSEAITQLFGKHLGGWMWWALILVITILGKLSHAWQCLNKKKDTKEQKKENGNQLTGNQKPPKTETEEKDLVEVIQNGRSTTIKRQEAIEKGLIDGCA